MISTGSFFSRQSAPLLGIDISSSSVKLVELGHDKSGGRGGQSDGGDRRDTERQSLDKRLHQN